MEFSALLIPASTFFAKVSEQYDLYRRSEKEKREKHKGKKKKSGGNFWGSFEIRNGQKVNAAVLASTREQRTTFAEAGRLFGINPVSAANYLQRSGAK